MPSMYAGAKPLHSLPGVKTMFPTIQQHQLDLFNKLNQVTLATWPGKAPSDWLQSVDPSLKGLYALPSYGFTRTTLRALWANKAVSTEVCVLSTLAWGEMTSRNARKLLPTIANWLSLCDEVRQGKHTRKSAFSAFAKLKAAKMMPGMGPAYFTKIIFFADPKGDGYILDQWTARSTHLLTGQSKWPAILVNAETRAKAKVKPESLRVRVVDRVTADHYEDYCAMVEHIGGTQNMHPHTVEEKLFSAGGHSPHPWRHHLMTSWAAGPVQLYK